MYKIVFFKASNFFASFFEFFKFIYRIIKKYYIVEFLANWWNLLSYLRLFCKIIYVFK
jgi:hypothetical protein